MSWGFDSGGGGGGPFTVLRRSYTIFDTSAIGSTSTVSAATMSYYVASIATWGGGGDATWNVYLKSGSGFSTSVGSGDQNTLGTTAQSSPKTSSSTSTGVYTSFTLNTMGNISKTSATRMGFKSANNDADNSAPPNPTVTTYSQNCSVYAADVTGESKDPKLVVTYTLPTTAAVTGEIGNGATEQAVRSAT